MLIIKKLFYKIRLISIENEPSALWKPSSVQKKVLNFSSLCMFFIFCITSKVSFAYEGGTNFIYADFGTYSSDLTTRLSEDPRPENNTVWNDATGIIHVIADYDVETIKINDQLQKMRDSGQTQIALILPFATQLPPPLGPLEELTDKNYFLIKERNANTQNSYIGLSEQNNTNLENLVKEIARIGFQKVVIRFNPVGASSPKDAAYLHIPGKYLDHLEFIKYTHNLIVNALLVANALNGTSTTALFDLGLELGGVVLGQTEIYQKALWKDYVAAFGNSDSIGFSIAPGINGNNRTTRMIEWLKEPDSAGIPGVLPDTLAFDVYGIGDPLDTKTWDESNDLTNIKSQLDSPSINMPDQPIIILESYYNSRIAAQKFADSDLNIQSVFQWQNTRSNHVSRYNERKLAFPDDPNATVHLNREEWRIDWADNAYASNISYFCQPLPDQSIPIPNECVKEDFNDDGKSDTLWRNFESGENEIYLMDGFDVTLTYLNTVDPNWEIAGTGDFNADGKSDILWRNVETGQNYIYFMDGTTIETPALINLSSDSGWRIAGIGNFNDDGKSDILWRHDSGLNLIYFMDGATVQNTGVINTVSDPGWKISGVGDFNKNGISDILWRHDSGLNLIYFMDGATIQKAEAINTVSDPGWKISGVGDFNADGKSDILWRNVNNGLNVIYFMDGANFTNATINIIDPMVWEIVGVGDYNNDKISDIFWRTTNGNNSNNSYVYLMNGTMIDYHMIYEHNYVVGVPTGSKWEVY